MSCVMNVVEAVFLAPTDVVELATRGGTSARTSCRVDLQSSEEVIVGSDPCGHGLYVIQEREQAFVREQLSLHSFQCLMLPQWKEQWHQGISLLATSPLFDLVQISIGIVPQVSGRCATKHQNEREHVKLPARPLFRVAGPVFSPPRIASDCLQRRFPALHRLVSGERLTDPT